MAFQQQVLPALTMKASCIVLTMLWCDALAEDAIKTKDVRVPLRQAMECGEKAIRFEVSGEAFELVRIPYSGSESYIVAAMAVLRPAWASFSPS